MMRKCLSRGILILWGAAVVVSVWTTGAAATEAARGAVTNLPLPRFVSLKTSEGNARRGPATNHRVDWVFTRRDMPLRVTAEYEHWRRVEDADGAGGWMHYALLSGVRSVIIGTDMTPLHQHANTASPVQAYLEAGVIARIISCEVDWCQVGVDGLRGWAAKADMWGVDPAEVLN